MAIKISILYVKVTKNLSDLPKTKDPKSSIGLRFWLFCKIVREKSITWDRNLVVGPSSADSANSHHFFFSRVQKANGIAEEFKEKRFLTRLFSTYGHSFLVEQNTLGSK